MITVRPVVVGGAVVVVCCLVVVVAVVVVVEYVVVGARLEPYWPCVNGRQTTGAVG